MLLSLKRVARWAAVLTLGAIGIAAWRMLGPPAGTGALALAATSPLAIHMGAHAFVDGFFAFWAALCVWLVWENLQRPREPWRLAALGIALAGLVMAKESALFVYLALCAALASARWLRLGTVTPPLLLVMLAGPLAGVLVLASLAGGFGVFVEIYRAFAANAQTLPYAIAHQDGPWHRYLLDLLTVDPLVLLLALSGLATVALEKRACLFLLVFTAASYALLCNIRFGQNLRFATIWLLPLSAFAAAQLIALASHARRRAAVTSIALFAAVCAFDLRQYRVLFVDHPIYDVVPISMLRALEIIKDPPRP